MGFPEVILPGDVRNDLYLTLINADFSKGSKTTDKNVQVTVTVCNDRGQLIPVSEVWNFSFCRLVQFPVLVKAAFYYRMLFILAEG